MFSETCFSLLLIAHVLTSPTAASIVRRTESRADPLRYMLGCFLCLGSGGHFSGTQPGSSAAVWGLIHNLLETKLQLILQLSCLYHTAGISVTHKSCYFKVREALENITWSLKVLACFPEQVLPDHTVTPPCLGFHLVFPVPKKGTVNKLCDCCHPTCIFGCQTTILWLSGGQPSSRQKSRCEKEKLRQQKDRSWKEGII